MSGADKQEPSDKPQAVTQRLDTLAASQDDWLCPGCSYSLRSISSERCPECGLVIDRSIFGVAQVPWVHRKSLGTWRAYWRTVMMTIRHPRTIARDVGAPVSLADARIFRRITSVIAWGSLLTATIACTLLPENRDVYREIFPAHNKLAWLAQGGLVLITLFSTWLGLFAATGVASYFFHPRHLSITRQNRAIALSHYACGPLAALSVAALAMIAIIVVSDQVTSERTAIMVCAAIGLLMLVPVAAAFLGWWNATLVLLARTTTASSLKVFAMALLLPTLWTLQFVLIAAALPVAYVWLWVSISGSLH